MTPITATIEVARPPLEAFAYVTDPGRFPEWQSGVLSGHTDGPGPPRVGDKCITTRRMGGSVRTVTAEITHVDPPHTWGVRSVDGPVRATIEVTVDPLDDARGSRVTIAVDFHGHGAGRVLVPLVIAPGARKEMPANMARLKERLESAPAAPAPETT